MLIYLRPLTSQPVGFRLAFSITLFSVLLPALRYMSNLPRIKTLIQNFINSRVFFKVCQRMRPVKSTNCGMSTEFFTCLPCQRARTLRQKRPLATLHRTAGTCFQFVYSVEVIIENQSSDLLGTYKAVGVVNPMLLCGFRKSSEMFGNSC